ncbi:MAG: pyridoxal-phosphate dependent enzyme [Bacteroidota bacterium]
MSINWQLPSPLQNISNAACQVRNIQLWLKREDQIHPTLSGNKWRKLKYNLQAARTQNYNTLVTFGGTFSNHIAATAAAGHLCNFQTYGIIRGEATASQNPTLQQAQAHGMQLHFVDRSTYRNANRIALAQQLIPEPFYFLPEGGTNQLALKGCAEIVLELKEQLIQLPDFVCVSCGTGGTIAGIIQGINGRQRVIGFSALKGDFLEKEVRQLLENELDNWEIMTDYHFGGYAKIKPILIAFMQQFYAQYQIPLEPIYTGKMLYGIFDLIEKGFFPDGSQIVAIHTGGLQGIEGINKRFGLDLPDV